MTACSVCIVLALHFIWTTRLTLRAILQFFAGLISDKKFLQCRCNLFRLIVLNVVA
jgi:hypothetical protein